MPEDQASFSKISLSNAQVGNHDRFFEHRRLKKILNIILNYWRIKTRGKRAYEVGDFSHTHERQGLRRLSLENPDLCAPPFPGTQQRHESLQLKCISVINIDSTDRRLSLLYNNSGKSFSRVAHPSTFGTALQPGTRMNFCGWPLRPGRVQANSRCLKLRASPRIEWKRIAAG